MHTTDSTMMAVTHDVPIGSLPRQRRQRRLEQLLDTRARLAQLGLQHRAHGRTHEAEELFSQQLAVEAALAEEFPDAYRASLAEWVRVEVEFTDHRSQVDPACRFCRPGAEATATAPVAA